MDALGCVRAEIALCERQIGGCAVCARPCHHCQWRDTSRYPLPGCYVCHGRGGRASGDDRCPDCREAARRCAALHNLYPEAACGA